MNYNNLSNVLNKDSYIISPELQQALEFSTSNPDIELSVSNPDIELSPTNPDVGNSNKKK